MILDLLYFIFCHKKSIYKNKLAVQIILKLNELGKMVLANGCGDLP